MTDHVKLGGLQGDEFFAHNVELPILEDAPALGWITDALDQAVAERKGVVVFGPKGTGKSLAAKRVHENFGALEREAESLDGRHQRRRVVFVSAPRAEKRVEVINHVHKALTGVDQERMRRGRRIPDDVLMDELVAALLTSTTVALIVDTGEKLSDEGIQTLSDLIDLAEARDQNRFSGTEYRSAGVGVLLLGTADIAARIRKSDEAGQRWVRLQKIEGLDPARVAEVYLEFLPGLHDHVESIGQPTWEEYVRVHVCEDKRLTLRPIENHVRNYIRRMAETDSSIQRRSDVGWNQEVFAFTLKELKTARRQKDDES